MRMARVRLLEPLRFNLTGYDRHVLELPAGEQEAPEAVAAFVRQNPVIGEVLLDGAEILGEPREGELPPFAAWTVGGLRQLAADWAIDVPTRIHKSDLVTLIAAEAARRAQIEAPPIETDEA